jgi:CelD/BcsL family acetyltransferase involved in cellulose biosynthesis/glycosyltransferase involved in cell wall biosynthesis
MSLTVLSVAYPLAPVSVDTAGGAEQVLAQIDAGLTDRGYRSIVVACEGSTVAGELVSIPAQAGIIDDEVRGRAQERTRTAIARVLDQYSVDVVHMHGIDFHTYLPRSEVPVLATLHLPPEWYPDSIFRCQRPATYLQCVSESQHSRCPKSEILLPPISNGIPVRAFEWASRKSDYALALGRICPEKGVEVALDAAELAGIPLVIAGSVYEYPEHRSYFEERIRPRLNGRVRWIGAADLATKRELLRNARCVLIPSLAPETSSLVAMEAFACGTPVVAFRSGALPEVISDGETGFVVDSAAEMADAIRRSGEIAPSRCRRRAETRFDVGPVVDRYIETYRRIARKGADRTVAEVLTTTPELVAVEPEWRSLFDGCESGSPFLHPAWQLAWWAHFGSCALHSIAIRRAGRLVAFAPLFIHEGRLVFVGNGISDQLGLLATDAEAAEALIRTMQRSGYGFDLQEIGEGSPLLRLPNRRCSVSPAVELGKPLPSKLRKNLRLQRKYLEDNGIVEVETVGVDQVDAALDHLFHLHAVRWHRKGEPSVLASDAVQRFHRVISRQFLRAGMLRMYRLYLESRVLGVFYGFRVKGVTCYYLGGFDAEMAQFSPGSLLIHHAIQTATVEGDRAFDFLRGDEAYKYRWGAVNRPQFHVYT